MRKLMKIIIRAAAAKTCTDLDMFTGRSVPPHVVMDMVNAINKKIQTAVLV